MANVRIPLARPVPNLPSAFWAFVPLPDRPEPSLLTEAERTLWEGFTAERRRREWFGGRIAGRSVLRAVGAGACSILRSENGAPRLVGPGSERVEIALTHGAGEAAAIATHRDSSFPHVGIDWVDQRDRRRLERIAKRVFDPSERRLCEAAPFALQLAWGARECIAKATRTGMFVYALSRVHLLGFDANRGTAEIDLPGVEVGFQVKEDGSLVVVAGVTSETFARAQKAREGP